MRACLERAVNLYSGDLLVSCYDDWILPVRERLRQRYTAALERLMAALEGQHAHREAIAYAQRSLQHDPLHEPTYRRLMRPHALMGDRAGALCAYHSCATVLEQELGVEPSPVTQEAYERLLQLEGAPIPAPQRTTARPHATAVPHWSSGRS